jgi:hypothetical protein
MRGNRAIVGGVVAAGLAAGVVLASGSVAGAAEPANQACVGESLSSLAIGSAGAFGAGVVFFAQEPTTSSGLGDNIQFFQAGVVPDEVVPNTCND